MRARRFLRSPFFDCIAGGTRLDRQVIGHQQLTVGAQEIAENFYICSLFSMVKSASLENTALNTPSRKFRDSRSNALIAALRCRPAFCDSSAPAFASKGEASKP